MKSIIRYPIRLLLRQGLKPNPVLRIRPAVKLNVAFRPVRRFGVKPRLELVAPLNS